jgi:hypothetical protein
VIITLKRQKTSPHDFETLLNIFGEIHLTYGLFAMASFMSLARSILLKSRQQSGLKKYSAGVQEKPK